MPRRADDYTLIWRKDTRFYFYRVGSWPRGKRTCAGTRDEKEARQIANAAFLAAEVARKAGPPKPAEPTLGRELL